MINVFLHHGIYNTLGILQQLLWQLEIHFKISEQVAGVLLKYARSFCAEFGLKTVSSG